MSGADSVSPECGSPGLDLLVRVPAAARPLVPLLPYQRADVESAARFNWCCWSRQIGKSFTKSLRRILRGLERRRDQIFISAGERQCRELMLKAQQHCRTLAITAEVLTGRACAGIQLAQMEIRLPNGVRVIGLPANPHTARGYTGDVLFDEFAMHRDDREIWSAVFPSVLRGDGEVDVASTPKGPANLFAELRTNAEFRHSTVTLHDAIAQGLRLDAGEIRRSMNDDALFRQEFLCEFLDEVGAFLKYEQIAGCEDPRLPGPVDLTQGRGACPERSERDAKVQEDENREFAELLGTFASLREMDVFVGVDIGRRRDLTVFWVLGSWVSGGGAGSCGDAARNRAPKPDACRASSDKGNDALVTLGVIEMRNEPFRRQYDALRRLLRLSVLRRCCIDAGGVGMSMAEAAREDFGTGRVEAVTFTANVKDRLATALKRRIEERTIRIPVDEAIRNDLHSVRWDVTRGECGRFVVSGGGDSHADRFWALALAVRAADGAAGGVIAFESAGGLRFARAGIW